jgi:hypothetical protein
MVLKYNRIMFLCANGWSCWHDTGGRQVVNNINDAVTVLRAHSYVLDEDTLEVRPEVVRKFVPPAPAVSEPEPEPEPEPEEPEEPPRRHMPTVKVPKEKRR